MTKSLLRLLVLPLLLSAPSFADVVVLGSDYFQTLPGSFGTFPGIATINFIGNPIGPGTTDTIQQRLTDATINGAPIPIQVVALSLVSANPVNIFGTFFDVAVSLDPANLANDVGTESIQGSLAGGTWTSSADVFVELKFTDPLGVVSIPDVFTVITVTNASSSWSPTPPPGNVIVTGPVGDQNANLHTGKNSEQVDFFVNSIVHTTATGPGGFTGGIVEGFGTAAAVPEPASIALLGLTLAGLALIRRRR